MGVLTFLVVKLYGSITNNKSGPTFGRNGPRPAAGSWMWDITLICSRGIYSKLASLANLGCARCDKSIISGLCFDIYPSFPDHILQRYFGKKLRQDSYKHRAYGKFVYICELQILFGVEICEMATYSKLMRYLRCQRVVEYTVVYTVVRTSKLEYPYYWIKRKRKEKETVAHCQNSNSSEDSIFLHCRLICPLKYVGISYVSKNNLTMLIKCKSGLRFRVTGMFTDYRHRAIAGLDGELP